MENLFFTPTFDDGAVRTDASRRSSPSAHRRTSTAKSVSGAAFSAIIGSTVMVSPFGSVTVTALSSQMSTSPSKNDGDLR
jgi:hypothetical protein